MKSQAASSANFFDPRYATTALVLGSIDSSYVKGFQWSPVYVNSGPGDFDASRTDAKEEVRTTRFTLLPGCAEAARIDLTPLIAGIMSSCSLVVVLYVNGWSGFSFVSTFLQNYGVCLQGDVRLQRG